MHIFRERKLTPLIIIVILHKYPSFFNPTNFCAVEVLKSIFDGIRTKKRYLNKLTRIELFDIINMLDPQNKSKYKRVEPGEKEFSSLITAIYQIRCNLFHGRKDVSEKEGKDWELVCLAYDLLFPIFDSYMKIHIV